MERNLLKPAKGVRPTTCRPIRSGKNICGWTSVPLEMPGFLSHSSKPRRDTGDLGQLQAKKLSFELLKKKKPCQIFLLSFKGLGAFPCKTCFLTELGNLGGLSRNGPMFPFVGSDRFARDWWQNFRCRF